MHNVINAQNIRKSFADFEAVRGLSFRVERGSVFGLLGPNGAGKTSTIAMVYGLSPKSGGELRVFGLDVATRWRDIRARVGVCQQDNTLDPDLSVRENLLVFAGYFALSRSESRNRTAELLDFFALEGKADANVRDLSGGMARRLMLARALINRPELLILDEPTTGLDPQSRHQLWNRLEELSAGGLTIFLTTHYMEEAATLCDTVLIMDHGKELVHDTPEALTLSHAGRAVLDLVDPGPEAVRTVADSGLDSEDLGRRTLVYGSDFQELETLRQRLPEGRFTLRPATLEDVFLRLTGRGLRE